MEYDSLSTKINFKSHIRCQEIIVKLHFKNVNISATVKKKKPKNKISMNPRTNVNIIHFNLAKLPRKFKNSVTGIAGKGYRNCYRMEDQLFLLSKKKGALIYY